MSAWASITLRNGGVTDVALALDSWRTPDALRPVLVTASIGLIPSSLTHSEIHLQVDYAGGTSPTVSKPLRAPAGLGGRIDFELTGWVPAGGAYRIANISNPGGTNVLNSVTEVTL